MPQLYDITRYAPHTLMVLTAPAIRTVLAAQPDSGSFLSHATCYRPGTRPPAPE